MVTRSSATAWRARGAVGTRRRASRPGRGRWRYAGQGASQRSPRRAQASNRLPQRGQGCPEPEALDTPTAAPDNERLDMSPKSAQEMETTRDTAGAASARTRTTHVRTAPRGRARLTPRLRFPARQPLPHTDILVAELVHAADLGLGQRGAPPPALTRARAAPARAEREFVKRERLNRRAAPPAPGLAATATATGASHMDERKRQSSAPATASATGGSRRHESERQLGAQYAIGACS